MGQQQLYVPGNRHTVRRAHLLREEPDPSRHRTTTARCGERRKAWQPVPDQGGSSYDLCVKCVDDVAGRAAGWLTPDIPATDAQPWEKIAAMWLVLNHAVRTDLPDSDVRDLLDVPGVSPPALLDALGQPLESPEPGPSEAAS